MSASGNGKNIGVYLTLFLNLVGWLVIAAWNVSAFRAATDEQIKNIKEESKQFRADIKELSTKLDEHISQTALNQRINVDGTKKKSNGRN